MSSVSECSANSLSQSSKITICFFLFVNLVSALSFHFSFSDREVLLIQGGREKEYSSIRIFTTDVINITLPICIAI